MLIISSLKVVFFPFYFEYNVGTVTLSQVSVTVVFEDKQLPISLKMFIVLFKMFCFTYKPNDVFKTCVLYLNNLIV